MPELLPPGQATDPEVVKAILARLFASGGAPPAMPGGQPPFVQPSGGQPIAKPLGPPAMTTPPAPAGPSPQQPGSIAKAMNTGGAGPEASNQPPATTPPVLSEQDWNKANPPAAHTPYKEPDLKHRLLMGLFSGMQEFGRPGEGAASVRDYLGNISKQMEQEQNQPRYEQARQHASYGDYIEGQKGPLQVRDLQAQAAERESVAKKNADQNELQRLYAQAVKSGDTAAAERYSDAIGELRGQQRTPRAEKAETPFSVWRQQNPTGKVEDWLGLEAKNKRAGERPERPEKQTPFDVWLRQNPKAPISDFYKVSGEGRDQANQDRNVEAMRRDREKMRSDYEAKISNILTEPAEADRLTKERDEKLKEYDRHIHNAEQGYKVGGTVLYQGKPHKISAIRPDGQLELEP